MNEIKSQRQIIQVGNSLAITIPANIVHKLKLQRGDAIDVAFRNDIQLDDEFYQSLTAVTDQYQGSLDLLRGEA
ncbi:AbrB/MazE/SpoVT family DNA-binding domain-containing protein [Secundilactobacillus similis]|jgi:antitoxin component of MazEF toxin-antitoxin module|uniref:AbrB/MazE/SpoVT family DNA-binding domain-containing protein n=1 Tax=Secundilactobacillus similis TaxID=414682 RepID=UPI0006CFBB01|nr:AbrB/MazE/SpoVT family DNA-binding domain-containing protein [Secundilactobacillus similis]